MSAVEKNTDGLAKSSPRIFEKISQWQAFRRSLASGQTLGFVPTMGALHLGHAKLVERAARENDYAVVSIFVNPTQFNNAEDLQKYPRTLERDLEVLRDAGASQVILPRYEELYADAFAFQVVESESSEKILCGASRPGHFRGVLTVVLKLLNLVRPHHAYFGEKDYQQLDLVRRMAAAFFLECEVVGCPTVRSKNGLALSSRNARLSSAGLEKAEKFAHLLKQRAPLPEIARALEKEGIEIDYLEEIENRRFGAVHIDSVRLIDNLAIGDLI